MRLVHLSEVPLTNPSYARPLRCLGAAALFAVAATGCAAGQRTGASASNDPDRKEWIDLFNGRNLDGWTAKFAKHEVGVNYANTFRVVDGMIQARYDGYGGNYNNQFGHLYYDKPYSYYLVSLEYRFVGELYPGAPSYTLRNSGIMPCGRDPPAPRAPLGVAGGAGPRPARAGRGAGRHRLEGRPPRAGDAHGAPGSDGAGADRVARDAAPAAGRGGDGRAVGTDIRGVPNDGTRINDGARIWNGDLTETAVVSRQVQHVITHRDGRNRVPSMRRRQRGRPPLWCV